MGLQLITLIAAGGCNVSDQKGGPVIAHRTGLTGSGLVLDPAGYKYWICLNVVGPGSGGCTSNGAPTAPMDLPAGTHFMTTSYSYEADSSETGLGSVTVSEQGAVTVNSSHFTWDDETNRLIAITAPVTVKHSGFKDYLAFEGFEGHYGPQWSEVLLTGRRYTLQNCHSVQTTIRNCRFSDNFDVKVTTAGIELGADTGKSFSPSVVNGVRTLTAITQPVRIEHMGHQGPLSLWGIDGGQAPSWTATLIVGRRYAFILSYSRDLTLDDTVLPPGEYALQVTATGLPEDPGNVELIGGLNNHMVASNAPGDHVARLKVGTMSVTSSPAFTGTFCVENLKCGTGGDTTITVPVVPGRRYGVTPAGSTLARVEYDGSCGSTPTIGVTGGDLSIHCSATTPPASCDSATAGTPCNDGNPCTTGDACNGGACAGTPVSCPDDGRVCTNERCEPAQGCVSELRPTCDDVGGCQPNPAGTPPLLCEPVHPVTLNTAELGEVAYVIRDSDSLFVVSLMGGGAETLQLRAGITYAFESFAVSGLFNLDSAGRLQLIDTPTFQGNGTGTLVVRDPVAPQIDVLTRANNKERTGANLSERILNHANVRPGSFGKLHEFLVDDQIYAQPLYASGVNIGGVTHPVLLVATANNSVFAFEPNERRLLWQRNFNGEGRPPRNDEVAGSSCDGLYRNYIGNIGITGTPVIHPITRWMYFVSRVRGSDGNVTYTLRALDIRDGEETVPPVGISGSVPGTGAGSQGAGAHQMIDFKPNLHNQRAALAIAGNQVIVTFGSYCDNGAYHGWVFAHHVGTLQTEAVFNTTPNGNDGGIWQAGAAPAVDASANIFLTTGNGSYGNGNWGMTTVKLRKSLGALNVWSSFTPPRYAKLSDDDDDFGSAGPSILPPPAVGLIANGSKEGKVFVMKMDNLGGVGTAHQIFPAVHGTGTSHIHNQMVFWNAPEGLNMYVGGENDFLRAYRFDPATQRFGIDAVRTSLVKPPPGMPGANMAISANGSAPGTGILWATMPWQGDSLDATVPGILRAFNAETLELLWEGREVGDDMYNFAKGTGPVVANGRVFVASQSGVVSLYGLRNGPTPPVKDATYVLRSELTAMCVHWDPNGTQVLQIPCPTSNPQWVLRNVANNVYEIKAKGTNNCLDFEGDQPEDGTNTRLAPCDGQSRQRWVIKFLGGARYEVRAESSPGNCLSVIYLGFGTRVRLGTCADGIVNHQFNLALDEVAPITSSLTSFRVMTVAGGCMHVDGVLTVVTDRTVVIQMSCSEVAAQRWRFRLLGDSSYEIRAAVSDKCLEVAHGAQGDAVNVWQNVCDESPRQRWNIERTGFGTYRLRPLSGSLEYCLDYADLWEGNDGDHIWQWHCTGGADQGFRIVAP